MKIERIIAYVLLCVAVAVGIVGGKFLYKYTNGFTGDLTTFYVRHDGQDFYSDTSLLLHFQESYRFDVKYSFDELNPTSTGKNRGYSVKLMPNPNAPNFDYWAYENGQYERCSFLRAGDLTKGLKLSKYASGFSFENEGLTIVMARAVTMAAFVNPDRPDLTYENSDYFPPDDFFDNYFFRLVISSYDGSSVVNIDLNLSGVAL